MSEQREPDMDPAGMYLEELFTDRRVGALRRLTPVTATGERDTSRPTLFIGQAEIMTNMGPVPINFEIEADTLDKAIAGFGKAATEAIERTVQQIQELRRQAASQLVVPQGNIPGLTGGGGMPPGRGGKIQLP
jgi:hypothetical protein